MAPINDKLNPDLAYNKSTLSKTPRLFLMLYLEEAFGVPRARSTAPAGYEGLYTGDIRDTDRLVRIIWEEKYPEKGWVTSGGGRLASTAPTSPSDLELDESEEATELEESEEEEEEEDEFEGDEFEGDEKGELDEENKVEVELEEETNEESTTISISTSGEILISSAPPDDLEEDEEDEEDEENEDGVSKEGLEEEDEWELGSNGDIAVAIDATADDFGLEHQVEELRERLDLALSLLKDFSTVMLSTLQRGRVAISEEEVDAAISHLAKSLKRVDRLLVDEKLPGHAFGETMTVRFEDEDGEPRTITFSPSDLLNENLFPLARLGRLGAEFGLDIRGKDRVTSSRMILDQIATSSM